jgi:hypothetical protein
MATFLCFAVPFLWPLIPALFLLPADEIRKILPGAFVESTLIALGLTSSVLLIVALCLGTQPLLDVQRQEPGIFWKLPGFMICMSFLMWGWFKITQRSDQLARPKRGIDSEPEFAATDKSKTQDSMRPLP